MLCALTCWANKHLRTEPRHPLLLHIALETMCLSIVQLIFFCLAAALTVCIVYWCGSGTSNNARLLGRHPASYLYTNTSYVTWWFDLNVIFLRPAHYSLLLYIFDTWSIRLLRAMSYSHPHCFPRSFSGYRPCLTFAVALGLSRSPFPSKIHLWSPRMTNAPSRCV